MFFFALLPLCAALLISNAWSADSAGEPGRSSGKKNPLNNGADTDLGYDVEFYSQLRLEYKLENDAKLGLGISHISNLALGDRNPGAETIYMSYGIRF